MDRFIGLIGIVVLLGLAYLLSSNRKKISLRIILTGLTLQFAIGFTLLRWEGGATFIRIIAEKVVAFLNLTHLGTSLLFGQLGNPANAGTYGFQFAFTALTMIIFFSAFMAALYYLGIMQKVIEAIAWIMQRLMRTSGAESLSCSANIFVGQTEAPLLVRPFLSTLTMSELMTIMIGGFATIAGSVFGAYVSIGANPSFLIIGSCMAVPGALMMGKILYPETEQSETAGHVKMPKFDMGSNLLDAIAKGTGDGLHLALNVAAMLIAFMALIGFVDMVLGWADGLIDGRLLGAVATGPSGEFSGFFPGSLKTFFGTMFRPIAFLMGVPAAESALVGQLLGLKIAVNEFIGYDAMMKMVGEGLLSHKAEMIATFALCGFANFSSIGIQIGGMAALAPDRRSDLAKLGLRAMFGGAIVTCITGTIAGLLM